MSDFGIPKFEIPKIEVADISAADIKTMSNDDLAAILSGDKNMGGIVPLPVQQAITTELLVRSIHRGSKPHWSVIPLFLVSVVAAVAACIAAYPVLFPAQQSSVVIAPSKQIVQHGSGTLSNSQPQSQRSVPALANTPKR